MYFCIGGERVAIDGLRTGALGFSVLRIWRIFGSVFAFENCGISVFALKTAFFSVLVSCAVCGFSPI